MSGESHDSTIHIISGEWMEQIAESSSNLERILLALKDMKVKLEMEDLECVGGF